MSTVERLDLRHRVSFHVEKSNVNRFYLLDNLLSFTRNPAYIEKDACLTRNIIIWGILGVNCILFLRNQLFYLEGLV